MIIAFVTIISNEQSPRIVNRNRSYYYITRNAGQFGLTIINNHFFCSNSKDRSMRHGIIVVAYQQICCLCSLCAHMSIIIKWLDVTLLWPIHSLPSLYFANNGRGSSVFFSGFVSIACAHMRLLFINFRIVHCTGYFLLLLLLLRKLIRHSTMLWIE